MPAELTTPQAAELLGVSNPRIIQMARSGALPIARRVGGANLYRRGDVSKLKMRPKVGRPAKAAK